MLNAAKDVSVALSSLLLATKNASGKSVADPEMEGLKTAAKVMIASVSSLIKTVKLSDDEAARGGRGLETAIEAINQELQVQCAEYVVQRSWKDCQGLAHVLGTRSLDIGDHVPGCQWHSKTPVAFTCTRDKCGMSNNVRSSVHRCNKTHVE